MMHLPARRRLVAGALAAATAIAVTASAPGGAFAAPTGETALYIVQTVSQPAAQHPATKVSEGTRLDARSAGVRDLVNRLREEHSATLKTARIDPNRKVYDYGLTFNGYAVKLTEAEASRLKGTKGVKQVWQDEIVHADTTTTRDFLGLTGSNGVWNKQFRGDRNAGLGVIVGVIDSGIWPESGSFAALSEPRPDQAAINAKWHGVCDSGPQDPFACNNKLIGARSFQAGITRTPFEFNSARGYSGHGTHTASTAAGNFGVPASINGFDLGTTSGMAPAARIAVYKGLWATANPDGTPTGSSSGSTADLAMAIETAIADGVDVINYSISGATNSIVRLTDIAFYNAAAAGVFISASAGNSGDLGPSQVNHNAPWMTTVAAGTHDRGNQKTVTLGDGTSFTGVGVVPTAVPSSPLVDSAAIPAAGFTSAQSTLCLLNSIDPAAAAGKIVICTRGTNDRVQKSLVVKNAGGVGMIHLNTTAVQSINGDWHTVPTVHFGPTEGAVIKAYAATAGATAAISALDTAKVKAPQMAGFSSYGPAIAGNGDLLKPDITAPGVDVIASVAPPGHAGKSFDGLSGTSMAAPHVAGLAALLLSKNPKWSPMWVKSALMTTASTKDNTGNPITMQSGAAATPINYGSGHVVPGSAFDPGLVYDSKPADWLNYGCALGQFQAVPTQWDCATAKTIDPSDLNYPSIAVGDLAGKQTVTRTVTNVTNRLGIYQAKVTAPPGFTATVSPEWMVILPGWKHKYTVTLTRTDAAFGQFSFGSLKLDEFLTGSHIVTSPIALRPVALAAPVQSNFSAAAGSGAISVTPGYTGTLTATVNGLTASAVSDLAFTGTGGFTPGNPQVSGSVKKITVNVPAGTALARFATFDDEAPAGTDTDMYVYRAGTTTLLAQSAGGTNEEIITTTAAGSYDIYVVMFAYEGATIPPIKFHGFVVPTGAAGNATVSPASASVTTGVAATVTLSWTGLTPGARYLGTVAFGDGTTASGRTIVMVN